MLRLKVVAKSVVKYKKVVAKSVTCIENQLIMYKRKIEQVAAFSG